LFGSQAGEEGATMSADSVRCHILEDNVTIVSDASGKVTNVVCPHFWRLTHGCQIKRDSVGFLTYFAGKVADKLTGTRAAHCEFGEPTDNPTRHFSDRF
jgi:hypothetical protein